MAKKAKTLQPHSWHNVHGDMIQFYLSSEEYYAEWLSPSLTVYRSQETKAIVGGEIPLSVLRRRRKRCARRRK